MRKYPLSMGFSGSVGSLVCVCVCVIWGPGRQAQATIHTANKLDRRTLLKKALLKILHHLNRNKIAFNFFSKLTLLFFLSCSFLSRKRHLHKERLKCVFWVESDGTVELYNFPILNELPSAGDGSRIQKEKNREREEANYREAESGIFSSRSKYIFPISHCNFSAGKKLQGTTHLQIEMKGIESTKSMLHRIFFGSVNGGGGVGYIIQLITYNVFDNKLRGVGFRPPSGTFSAYL